MRCPYCRHADSRVVDSREADDGQLIRRRRSCPECGKRFTTVEEAVLAVVKRSGVTEPFSRTKIMSGVRKACQGRPVDEDSIALLAQKVEETVRAKGAAEVPSHDVGLAILGPLRELDQVAYLRFASVYKSFDSLDEFEKEIAALREATVAREAAVRHAVATPPVAERPATEDRAEYGLADEPTAADVGRKQQYQRGGAPWPGTASQQVGSAAARTARARRSGGCGSSGSGRPRASTRTTRWTGNAATSS